MCVYKIFVLTHKNPSQCPKALAVRSRVLVRKLCPDVAKDQVLGQGRALIDLLDNVESALVVLRQSAYKVNSITMHV